MGASPNDNVIGSGTSESGPYQQGTDTFKTQMAPFTAQLNSKDIVHVFLAKCQPHFFGLPLVLTRFSWNALNSEYSGS